VSKIIVDTIESSGTTVTINDNLDGGTNTGTFGTITGLTATSITSGTIVAGILNDGIPLQQLVTASHSTTSTSTSGTYVDTGLSGTITPSSTDSKILVTANVFFGVSVGGGATASLGARLVRGSTDVLYTLDTALQMYSDRMGIVCSIQYLDSPSTTSATTYKIQFNRAGGGEE